MSLCHDRGGAEISAPETAIFAKASRNAPLSKVRNKLCPLPLAIARRALFRVGTAFRHFYGIYLVRLATRKSLARKRLTNPPCNASA